MSGRVAMLAEAQKFQLHRIPRPEPGHDELLIRVQECGICGSDLKMWAGTHAFIRPPVVMGHEVVGVVEQSGAAVALLPGTPVTIFPPIGCGTCFHCRNDRQQLCESMEFIGGQRAGGLADYLLVPASHVLQIPNEVPPGLRVLIEPVSVAVHAVARGASSAEDRCLVLGAGPVGMFTALVLRERGAEQVIVVDVIGERRRRAEVAGFDTFDPSVESLSDGVSRLLRPEGADVVFECVGSQATISAALAVTRKGGTTVIVGNSPPTLEVDGLALQRGDRSLVGVLMYDRKDFLIAMSLLADGLLESLDTSALVVHYDFDSVDDAFDDARSGQLSGLKAAVRL